MNVEKVNEAGPDKGDSISIVVVGNGFLVDPLYRMNSSCGLPRQSMVFNTAEDLCAWLKGKHFKSTHIVETVEKTVEKPEAKVARRRR